MWATRRRTFFILSIFTFIIGGVLFFSRDILFPVPVCTDHKMNGTETGIDCGGSCAQKCVGETIPLGVEWAKVFDEGKGHYDIAAMISNKNISSSPRQADVTFTVSDKKGSIIFHKKIQTFIPRSINFPLVLPDVKLSSLPDKVKVVLEESYSYSLPDDKMGTLAFTPRFDTDSMKRVDLIVQNTMTKRLTKVPVTVILYDVSGSPFAIGQTIIPRIESGEKQKVYVTWNTPFTEVPAIVRAYASIDPYLDFGQ